MNEPVIFTGLPSRVVFDADAFATVCAELARLDRSRALVLTTPQQSDLGQKVVTALGNAAVGHFSKAAMHTPVEVTDAALQQFQSNEADSVIAIGGGSTTGLAKAICRRTGARQLIIPTTYAGSEMTPILGETENEVKTTIIDSKLLPSTVIYDVTLTIGLPTQLTLTSGMNALAHAIEALYAKDRNPVISLLANEAVKAMALALPALSTESSDRSARRQALYAAWLSGASLGSVGMALHHKLCHTLGGTLNLPHAQTHAVMLPYTVAFNAPVTKDLLLGLIDAFGEQDVGKGLFQFARTIGTPRGLRDIGMREIDIDRVCDLAMRKPYWNPRSFLLNDIRRIVRAAWAGDEPVADPKSN